MLMVHAAGSWTRNKTVLSLLMTTIVGNRVCVQLWSRRDAPFIEISERRSLVVARRQEQAIALTDASNVDEEFVCQARLGKAGWRWCLRGGDDGSRSLLALADRVPTSRGEQS